MKIFKKIINIVFVLSLISFIFFSFFKQPFPAKNAIADDIKNLDPVQVEIKKEPISIDLNGYEYVIHPLYSYELYGLVVSEYDAENWIDITHEEDPGNVKDICVVWGKNITDGAYKKLKYKSGEFTCFVYADRGVKFYGKNLSNNHLLPANKEIKDTIKKASIGDQIYFRGYLSRYDVYENGDKLFTRGTSTTRDDSGNGACEVVYVEDFKILKGNGFLYKLVKKYSLYSLLSSGGLGIILFVLF